MHDEPLILAVDVGTTNIKAGVVDARGRVIKTAQQELPLLRDETGKAEHDAEAMWNTLCTVCRQVSSDHSQQIHVLVLSAYQLSLLPVDEHDKPLTGIITLLDTRPQQTYSELRARADATSLYQRTGCPLLFHYPLSKTYWLKRQHPELFAKARRFVGAKDYLIYRLTGQWVTEPSLGTATQMMNLNTLQWDDYALQLLELDAARLPEPVDSHRVLCELPPHSCAQLGVREGCLLVPGVYDGGAVAIGIGAMLKHIGAMNLGTTAMLRVALPEPLLDADPSMRLQTCYLACDRWFPGGAINNAGVVLRWLRDSVLYIDYDTMNREAQTVTHSANLYFLPFLSGERNPQIGNAASGVFFGLRGYHGRGHIVRAAMEGVCFALRNVLEALLENGVRIEGMRIGGGGSRSELWMQTMANVLALPLQVSRVDEPGLVGSAILGYTALGVYTDVIQATNAMVQPGEHYPPDERLASDYRSKYAFFRRIMTELTELFAQHAQWDDR